MLTCGVGGGRRGAAVHPVPMRGPAHTVPVGGWRGGVSPYSAYEDGTVQPIQCIWGCFRPCGVCRGGPALPMLGCVLQVTDEASVIAEAKARLPAEPGQPDPNACRIGQGLKLNQQILLYRHVLVDASFVHSTLQCSFLRLHAL